MRGWVCIMTMPLASMPTTICSSVNRRRALRLFSLSLSLLSLPSHDS